MARGVSDRKCNGLLRLVLGLHVRENLHGVLFLVTINDRVVRSAQENDVLERVPLLIRLLRVVASSFRPLTLDVAHLADDSVVLDKRLRAARERANVSAHGK
jgi:hypothetical protein